MIYLAADHRGFELKDKIKGYLLRQNKQVEEVGAFSYDEDDDYVDFAKAACEKIIFDPANNRGIFICGSGHGMGMVANKFKGLRAALCLNRRTAIQSREHEDANVLVLPADWLNEGEAIDIALIWLATAFKGEERHMRRLNKIGEIEEKNFK